jgi:hypothetical protein
MEVYRLMGILCPREVEWFIFHTQADNQDRGSGIAGRHHQVRTFRVSQAPSCGEVLDKIGSRRD